MKIKEDFWMGDGDEYFSRFLAKDGWIRLWRPAPYHWVAMHIEKRSTLSYTEGDIFQRIMADDKEFLGELQRTKDYWVQYEGEYADPVLCAAAEPYGFLTGGTITLNPPKCMNCGALMYPTHDTNEYSCLRCGDYAAQVELLGERLRAENVSEEEYNRRMGY